jgi:hypothetical protein
MIILLAGIFWFIFQIIAIFAIIRFALELKWNKHALVSSDTVRNVLAGSIALGISIWMFLLSGGNESMFKVGTAMIVLWYCLLTTFIVYLFWKLSKRLQFRAGSQKVISIVIVCGAGVGLFFVLAWLSNPTGR